MVTFVEISKIYDTISIVVTFFSLVARWHCLRSNSCTIRICHIWSSFFTIFKVSFYRDRLIVVICQSTCITTTATTCCQSTSICDITSSTVKCCTTVCSRSYRISICCNTWANTCSFCCGFGCFSIFSCWSSC